MFNLYDQFYTLIAILMWNSFTVYMGFTSAVITLSISL